MSLRTYSAIQAAASDSDGHLSLHTAQGDLGGSHFATHGPCSRCVTVRAVTIDTVLAELSDEKIALMKVDVQGSETTVLEGARATLQRNPDLILIIEELQRNAEDELKYRTEIEDEIEALMSQSRGMQILLEEERNQKRDREGGRGVGGEVPARRGPRLHGEETRGEPRVAGREQHAG